MEKNLNPHYARLYKYWKEAYVNKSGKAIQGEVNDFWNSHKANDAAVKSKIEELRAKAEHNKHKSSLVKWMKSVKETKIEHADTDIEQIGEPSTTQSNPVSDNPVSSSPKTSEVKDVTVETLAFKPAPAQERTQNQIASVNQAIARVEVLKQNGFSTKKDRQELEAMLKEKKKLETTLKRQKSLQENSKKYRANKKVKLNEAIEKFPELADVLKESNGTRTTPGRPRIEEKYPLLLKTIVDIVAPEASADVGRRSELLRACTTLKDLKQELERRIEGLRISESGLYLRLLPRKSSSTEGKRHIKTVPVKLVKAQNDKHKSHSDSHFAAAVNLHYRNFAEAMGDETCFVLSQDDKARVHLGLPAASKEAPILMHLEYRVRLPDHDYVIARRHKLIPSVYAGLTFSKRKLTYSGPTYVCIRSGKHDKSTAASHAIDLHRLANQDSFRHLARTTTGNMKPLLFIFSDGGPDENPRFPKVLDEMVKTFKLFDLDGLFLSCHAPGQSAYNQVERRMAPLSRDLAGLILPHNHYGTHLDENGITVNRALELKNFAKAGETLAEVWSGNCIDKFPVIAEYVCPEVVAETSDKLEWFTEKWRYVHVRQAQYSLQITKCNDETCCKPIRSNFRNILPMGFIPAPILFTHSPSGPRPCEKATEDGYFGTLAERMLLNRSDDLAFDQYCPSVQDELEERTCKICKAYFVSKTSLNSHRKALHVSSLKSIEETIEAVIEMYTFKDDDSPESGIEIISDMTSWLTPVFVDADE